MSMQRTEGGILQKNTLKVYNTITKEKEPLQIEKSLLRWYTCGPTVYDSAHLGHARSYVLLDSIRKTLERYFRYKITYIMNITDIDDKIIIKARDMLSTNSIEHLEQAVSQISIAPALKDLDLEIDSQKRIHAAVKYVSQKYEQEFFRDMQALGVDLPTYTTRVSEYVEEIVQFIEKIEAHGYAYESEGSVYFNVREYSKKHAYPLMCATHNQQELLEEGEGKLEAGEKKSKEDFVLWKKSKEGEPAWPSKWGAGRPGWHIECSAMASNVANGRIDMHSGGIDLMFPHHDNEIAQSEGAGYSSWVGHFLHTGHLHINGLKMSKSLKNFIKVEELLSKGSPRELRMMFLLQNYRGPMVYGEESLERAKVLEKKIFRYISLHMQDTSAPAEKDTVNAVTPFAEKEHKVLVLFEEKVEEIDAALKDDFNFPRAIELVLELIAHMEKVEHKQIHAQVARFIRETMHAIGLEVETTSESADTSNLISVISQFRNEVRGLAKASANKGAYFQACDNLRATLSSLGVIIEDAATPSQSSSIRKKI
ncbi:cysteinyl-tRNA synthetase [Nematocida sp. AWRm77]|nr:cysteinyl-tRNA synthetase [Nematocida sp. AWRm77]